jgi:hypothetical protein
MTTPDSFVPLTAASAPSTPREFQVAILNGHGQDHANGNGNGNTNGHTNGNGKDNGKGTDPKSGFQSLESQRPGTNGTEKRIGEPRVTLQRDGDRITHLRIQCTCGQIIDLACVYDAPPAGT